MDAIGANGHPDTSVATPDNAGSLSDPTENSFIEYSLTKEYHISVSSSLLNV
ncbi:unnamed protein product [Fusarium venenatum]|uniref:Uncharacterized protein n=1 Tax=Fusarium venenatum TaxID=56646 RepID=A0A2L2TM05_9HYPO|nr:uncharacterized protein FVRRES_04651 [Fusarium venenatum]CEI60215.1 unnamed protein product [Fusarium venenatum]